MHRFLRNILPLLLILPIPIHAEPPQTVEALYADFNPRKDPLETQVVKEWTEGDITFRYVTYHIGAFKGKPARMAAFFAFPTGKKELPTVMHMHGGGQRANLRLVRDYAERGYACLSVNWGGRPMEGAAPEDANTDWGAVDPTQNNVGGYSNLLPGPKFLDPFESPRNNNWYLLNLGGRRGITFLEHQPEVDNERIGVFGHSMGGRLTGLVAGTDPRVKAAAPSVGGSGFLQTDLPGLLNSRRRVKGSLDLFQATMSGQVYLKRIQCPILYLSACNDFNAPMDFVARGMKLVPHVEKRETYAPHLNHRFTPPHEVCRPLWFDTHLKGTFTFPAAPGAQLVLKRDDGIPLFRFRPDTSQPIERVDLYYGYERDPRNRFWVDARAVRNGDTWEAPCPVIDLDEPLFAYANVHYKLKSPHSKDPDTFALSAFRAAYPNQLKAAGVKATATRDRLLDDFARGWHDWYVLNGNNPHHWHFATRKPADPRWAAPEGAKLLVNLTTDAAENTLAVVITKNAWRSYAHKKKQDFVAKIHLPEAGAHQLSITAQDFKLVDDPSTAMADWTDITELALKPADKALPKSGLTVWKGKVPTFKQIRWEGGTYGSLPKPFLPKGATGDAADFQTELQEAIDASIEQEKLDKRR